MWKRVNRNNPQIVTAAMLREIMGKIFFPSLFSKCSVSGYDCFQSDYVCVCMHGCVYACTGRILLCRVLSSHTVGVEVEG